MLRLLIAFLLTGLAPGALAETPVALFESFAGNVNFAGTQKTIRTGSNQTNPCGVVGQNTDVQSVLSGIPSGATILRAHLYWAGSGASPDYSVQMDRVNVNAASNRRYTATTNGRSYFGGAANVTSLVASKGNGTYRFRRLSVDNQSSYCQVEGVTGGFALLVVYSHPGQPFRVLNVYEGFQPTYYTRVDLTLSNFRIPNPVGSATGRIGHITWEGDATLGNTNAENLFFNDVEMTDALNPRYNQFNSASNINNDGASYGIDFDAYTVAEPVIQAGQSVATTRYQSGQDLVLLHSEVIAVPNVPVSDLSIGKTVASPVMTQGVTNSYQLTVSNNGPMAEPGPIVVTDTISSDLAILAATGTGWSCTVNGQLVTCSWSGAVAPGTTLSPITISVSPAGTPPVIENTAVVAGQNFDNNPANNSASVTTGGAAADYVLTTAPCVANLAFSDARQTCNIYPFDNMTAGTPLTSIYITALNANGTPRILHNKQDVTLDFYFGLSCINPSSTAGIRAAFTAAGTLAECAASGTRTYQSANAAVTFENGTPSSRSGYTLTYNDVGMVELYFRDAGGGTGSSGAFVSRPHSIALTGIRRTSDGFANPAATGPAGAAFIAAGAPFSMTISALASNGQATPNFGRETVPERFAIAVGAAIDPATGAVFAEMTNVPVELGDFGAIAGGSASGSAFAWPEVGILRLVPGTASGSYLGRGPVAAAAVNVGRFHPHHFDTAADEPLADLCPVPAPCAFGGAYSGQPFEVTVSARNMGDAVTRNYQGRFAREVRLSAWNAAGNDAVQANPPASPAGSVLSGATVAAAMFDAGAARVSPAYTLPNPFSSVGAAARAGNWVAPVAIYLRAAEAAGGDGVSSNQAAASEEAPVWIVAGRLQVSGAYGSELLNLPVPVRAQYWTGTRWVNSVTDSVSAVTPLAANLEFFDCTGGLATNCTLAPLSTAPFTLAGGAGTLRLQAPGSGRSGAARLRVKSPAWLPGTVGQLVFGKRKASLDYIREVY